MRLLSLVAAVALLGVAPPSASQVDERPLWERMGISKERFDAITEVAVVMASTAYHVGACEQFADPRDADEMVASIMRAGKGEGGPVMDKLRSVWTESYADGRLAKGRFTGTECAELLRIDERDLAVASERLKD